MTFEIVAQLLRLCFGRRNHGLDVLVLRLQLRVSELDIGEPDRLFIEMPKRGHRRGWSAREEAERIEQTRPNRLLKRVYGQKEAGTISKGGTG